MPGLSLLHSLLAGDATASTHTQVAEPGVTIFEHLFFDVEKEVIEELDGGLPACSMSCPCVGCSHLLIPLACNVLRRH